MNSGVGHRTKRELEIASRMTRARWARGGREREIRESQFTLDEIPHELHPKWHRAFVCAAPTIGLQPSCLSAPCSVHFFIHHFVATSIEMQNSVVMALGSQEKFFQFKCSNANRLCASALQSKQTVRRVGVLAAPGSAEMQQIIESLSSPLVLIPAKVYVSIQLE